MRDVLRGSTDQSVVIRIIDATDGTPETAVEHNTSGIDLWYRREGGAKVSITEAALASADAAHADGGIEHIGDGYYRVDLPDAAVASGSAGVLVGGTVTGMIVIGAYLHLTAYNPLDAVRLGLTALPNAAADAAGGLPISDAGGFDVDALAALLTRLTSQRAGYLDNLSGGAVSLNSDMSTLLSRLSALRAGYLDNLSGGAVALNSDMSTLLSRLSSARAGYLDNLNAGGVVASQADINALNQSASRRLIITSVQQFERPETGDSASTFTVEARTYDGDGAAVNADSTPTLTATGSVTGSLAANLSSSSSPATGVYRWTYTVASTHGIEQVRFDLSATISSSTFTLSHYSQVVDFVATEFTTSDRTKIESIFNKLPSKSYLTGTANADGDVQLDEATGTPANSAGVTSLLSSVGTPIDLGQGATIFQNQQEIHNDVNVSVSRLGTPAGVSLSADVAAVKSDTTTLLSRITSTLFSGITYLSRWLAIGYGKTADSTTLAEVNATTAGTSYNNTTDSPEAIRDRGDAAWAGGDATLAKQTEILTAISGLSAASGSGAYTLTVQVTDGTTALQGAKVRLTQGVTTLSAVTNASGIATFAVDAATWSVAITKDGYSFTPTTKVVSGTGSQAYAMTAVVITPPSSPTLSTVTVQILTAAGAAQPKARVKVRLTASAGGSGNALLGDVAMYTADDEGVVEMELIQDATYQIQVIGYRTWHEFSPNADTYEIPDLVAGT